MPFFMEGYPIYFRRLNEIPEQKSPSPIDRFVFGCGGVAGLLTQAKGQKQASQVILHALKLGVNKFDTAPIYGQTHSEKNLGDILQDLKGEYKQTL